MDAMELGVSHSPHKRDRTSDNFVRAMLRLMKRSNKVSQLYGADIYVVARWRNRHYMYCSTDDPEFPPSPKALVSEEAGYFSYDGETDVSEGQGVSTCSKKKTRGLSINSHRKE
jgi:hypothetical protein